MECDDEHAATLSEMMQSYAGRPGWYEDCREALHHALELRREFFDEIYRHVLGQHL